MIVSGDRESEVRYLADQVGITDIHAQKTPEDKLAIVRRETAAGKTLFVGDGINDAPAMMAATVGMAIGQTSDVTSEAAGVVIMDNSLEKVDEFMHITYIPHSVDASFHCVSDLRTTIKDQQLIYSFRSTGLRPALEPGFFQSVAGTCGSS